MQNPANAVYHGGAIPNLGIPRRIGNSIMTTVTIEEAQAKLKGRIYQMTPENEHHFHRVLKQFITLHPFSPALSPSLEVVET
jgi:hypothetical protein